MASTFHIIMRIRALGARQKRAIEEAYHQAQQGREKVRYLTLKLLAQGYTRKEVSTIVGVSLGAIGKWVTGYHHRGVEGLQEKGQPGNHHQLTVEQKDQIGKILKEKTPEDCGYGGRFWTVELLKGWVRKEYGIFYRCDQSYRNLFQRAGFSFHKPKKVHKNQSPYMRKRFEEKLKKNSRNTGEKMVWYW